MEMLYYWTGVIVVWGLASLLAVTIIGLLAHLFDCLKFSMRIKRKFPKHKTIKFAFSIFLSNPTSVYVDGYQFDFKATP